MAEYGYTRSGLTAHIIYRKGPAISYALCGRRVAQLSELVQPERVCAACVKAQKSTKS